MKILRILDVNFEAWMVSILLVCITALIGLQVVCRYIFESSLSWSEELVQWCFIWFIWVGVSYGFQTRRHVSVTLLINKLPPILFKIITILTNIIILWFMYKLLIYGLKQATSTMITQQSSIVLVWPFTDQAVGMRWLYASLPFGALLSMHRLIRLIIEDIYLINRPINSINENLN
ncbi:putative TRAP transporter small permease protein [Gammaproteobacteria bacterium]|nr:putative TRAP transporter small permease protein [Gammaproteobacteria bacterium]